MPRRSPSLQQLGRNRIHNRANQRERDRSEAGKSNDANLKSFELGRSRGVDRERIRRCRYRGTLLTTITNDGHWQLARVIRSHTFLQKRCRCILEKHIVIT